MKRQKEIVIEIERVRVVSCRTHSYQGWCTECRDEVEFITEPEAAAIADKSVDDIHTSVERVELHAGSLPDGTRLVCLNSLLCGEKGFANVFG